jgi:lipoyl(octanoyl) transferase
MSRRCVVYHLGLLPYEEAWQIQRRLAEAIAAGEHSPTLLLLEHPHTFTFGRRGQVENLLWDDHELTRLGVSVIWVDRGGDVTYHGPGQLVGYPLLPLAPGGLQANTQEGSTDLSRTRLPQADYVGYIRKLEEMLILAMMRLGFPSGQVSGLTGVWVQPFASSRHPANNPEARPALAKIAAIGVKVDAKGISQHGFSLNVNPDMKFWDGIIGCGLSDHPVASLAEMRNSPPSMQEVMNAVISAFGEVFRYEMIEAPPDLTSKIMPGKGETT